MRTQEGDCCGDGMDAEERYFMRIKNRRQFEQLIRRYDGEVGGGSAATTSATATTAETTAATTQTATTETQATPFKAFASEADYQKDIDFKIQQALKTHEEKLKGKLTPEIRAALEKEANMTAEQKYQAQLDQLEADKKTLATERARIKAESLFAAKGIGEAERAVMLDRCVTDNEEDSVKNAQALLDAVDKAVKEQIKVAMKDVKPPNSTATGKGTETPAIAYAKDLADRRTKAATSSKTAIDYYLGGK